MADDRDEERRRRDEDAEEERRYWEQIEDDEAAEREREAEAKRRAIEKMENWFFEQFEDPQNETPRDSENQSYFYPWGGPFDAGDVLRDQFGYEYDAKWIDETIELIEKDGTTEWAPTSSGDYYEHPDPENETTDRDGETARISARVLQRLDALETALAVLPAAPANIGHNVPPETIGLPPYSDEDAAEMRAAIEETRSEIEREAPDPTRLATLARRFGSWSAKLGSWLAKKGDLAVDELIKNSIKALTWTTAIGLLGEVAHDLLELARHLLARL